MPLHQKGVELAFIPLQQPIRGLSIMLACQSSYEPETKELQRGTAPWPEILKKGEREGEKSMFSAGEAAPGKRPPHMMEELRRLN